MSGRGWTRMLGSIILVLATRVPGASANGPNIGRDAGTVFPLTTDRIQLVSEFVTVRLSAEGGAGSAECLYVLRNLTDEKQSFEMAFLTGSSYRQDDPENRASPALDLHVSHGRRELVVSMAALDRARWEPLIANPPDSIPVWKVVIEPRADAALWISYGIGWSGGGEGRSHHQAFTYYAKPAASWAGRIEQATIVFALNSLTAKALACLPDSATCVQRTIEPAGYRWTDAGLRWDLNDWEPAEDFRLDLRWMDPD